jgi:hypothetical protein
MRSWGYLLAMINLSASNLVSAAPPWASAAYQQVAIPVEYTHSKAKPIQLSSEYPRQNMPLSIRVADLVKIYGTPSAAYLSKLHDLRSRSYLVYELKDGYWFAAQMPPALNDGRFYAAMLYDPSGKPLGPIIK